MFYANHTHCVDMVMPIEPRHGSRKSRFHIRIFSEQLSSNKKTSILGTDSSVSRDLR